jgi:hypothetical protein
MIMRGMDPHMIRVTWMGMSWLVSLFFSVELP